MVLLSASICTKSGKALVGRQFMEVSRSRIEGLLAAFPKLINSDGQHTFVETDNVRYVYQPLDSLYMVLITTKNSNILEDLETLRLFARVVPEYCPEMTEADVCENAFELIFAFDEIVALGYRENVNLSQIRTYIEMESHDENIHRMIKMRKELEQKEIAKRKRKEIDSLKRRDGRGGIGGGHGGGGMGSISASMGSLGMDTMGDGGDSGRFSNNVSMSTPSTTSTKKSKSKSGWKLGKKGKKGEDDFMEQLKEQGQNVMDEDSVSSSSGLASKHVSNEPAVEQEGVHLKVEEKIILEANRDGGLDNMDVKGIVNMQVNDENLSNVKVQFELDPEMKSKFIFKTHPNVDKKQWTKDVVIGLKQNRPFPIGVEVGVVKWSMSTTDETLIPLTINCWPEVHNDGTCEVSCDYELTNTDLELEGIVISVPVSSSPKVNNVDGNYSYERRDGVLKWELPRIDGENPEGSLEFKVSDVSSADDFFPVNVQFVCHKTYAGLTIVKAFTEDDDDVTFSSEISLTPEAYDYV